MSSIDEMIARLCPEGVEFRELQELFILRNGYTPPRANPSFWVDGVVPWFRMEDIRENGRILHSSLELISSEAVKGDRLFPANSLLVATSATIGEHALVTVPHLSNQRFTSLALRPSFRHRLDMKFAFYCGFLLDEWCRRNVTTSSFSSVDMDGFRRFKFPLPPLELQHEIVKVLDTFTALEAELEAELEARRRQYEYYRDALLTFDGDPSVTGRAGGRAQEPRHVRWMTLGEISKSVTSGGTPSTTRSDYYDGGIPWLRTQEVDNGMIFSTQVMITDAGLLNSAAKWIPSGCVIVAMYGATAAKVAMNAIPLTTNQACCNLEIDYAIAIPRYVFHWIISGYARLKSLGEGSQSNLNAAKVKAFPIAVPPLEEQARIVTILDQFDSLVNDLSVGLPAELNARRRQYEYYRDRLLTFREAA